MFPKYLQIKLFTDGYQNSKNTSTHSPDHHSWLKREDDIWHDPHITHSPSFPHRASIQVTTVYMHTYESSIIEQAITTSLYPQWCTSIVVTQPLLPVTPPSSLIVVHGSDWLIIYNSFAISFINVLRTFPCKHLISAWVTLGSVTAGQHEHWGNEFFPYRALGHAGVILCYLGCPWQYIFHRGSIDIIKHQLLA